MALTQLQLLHMLSINELSRRIMDTNLTLDLALDEAIPHDVLYGLIREVADEQVPDKLGQDELILLHLALENPAFANSEVSHVTFTEWEEMGNSCTPLALIRENIYQWLVQELEAWAGTHV